MITVVESDVLTIREMMSALTMCIFFFLPPVSKMQQSSCSIETGLAGRFRKIRPLLRLLLMDPMGVISKSWWPFH